MFQKFEVRGVHASIDERLKNYAGKKIGGLDRYVSRHNRDSAHCIVELKVRKSKDHNNCLCEVSVHLPQETIVVKEQALNLYAAIDIVETKLKLQLKKYKERHASGKLRRHLSARFSRKAT